MKKEFMKGNEVLAEAALRAGLEGFFGYPITPATEITEYLAKAYSEDLEREKSGKEKLYPDFKCFLQMESEIGAINAVSGATATGKRAMTATASPGFSLMQEEISYIAGQEIPVVIANIMRGGPGLGNIGAEQSDYFMATRGGHGDFKSIVIAPNSIQEMAEHMFTLFNLTDKYRVPGILLADGFLGQMKEDLIFPDNNIEKIDKSHWVADGNLENRTSRSIKSLRLQNDALEEHKGHLISKYSRIQKNEMKYEGSFIEDADTIIVAYGIVSRIAEEVIYAARKEGKKIGLFRPITLWPFPSKRLEELSQNTKKILTIELSQGQMVEDVRLSVNGNCPVEFYGRGGGNLPTKKELVEILRGI